ncbi:MAG: lipopolysaccharide biosynthesis protein, partial [Gammaproteobacteria bacterium]|nr:lipopolysaccharide biosynthesis protein [Gammaproteobacteria bacterium]
MSRSKAKSAFIWNGLDVLMRNGVGFIISVVLARLLVPEDFGTLALLALFLGIANLFVNAGFSVALIQKQNATHTDESTVFWFNIASAFILTLALMAFSPWLAAFFSLPILSPLTKFMACNIFISAVGSIHNVLLVKQLDFKTLIKVGSVSTIISGCIGIYMAIAGYGIWALAGHAISSALVRTVLLWVVSSWRPKFRFSYSSFRKLSSFGGWIFAAHSLDTIYQRGYTILIGKFYGTHALGIYNRADSTQQLPIGILTSLVTRVTFPLFSSVNKDTVRLLRGVKLSVRSITLVTTPAMVGLGVLAEPFIGVIFGEQWLPAVPILQVLCITGILWPLHAINLNALQAQGHAKLFFRLAIIKKTIGIFTLIIGSFFGVMGIAWSRVIQSFISVLINAYYT